MAIASIATKKGHKSQQQCVQVVVGSLAYPIILSGVLYRQGTQICMRNNDCPSLSYKYNTHQYSIALLKK